MHVFTLFPVICLAVKWFICNVGFVSDIKILQLKLFPQVLDDCAR